MKNKKQEKRQGNANYITCRIKKNKIRKTTGECKPHYMQKKKKNDRGMQTTLHVEQDSENRVTTCNNLT